MTQTPRPSDGPCVAYLVDRYPVLSQTFVSNEIAELRRLGRRVLVAAMQPGDGDIGADPDAFLVGEAFRVHVARRRRVKRVVSAAAWTLRAPRAMASRDQLTDRIADPEKRSHHFVRMLASRLRRENVSWIHSHFAWVAAGQAVRVGQLLDVPVSITLHAKDQFLPYRDFRTKLSLADRVISVCEYNEKWLAENYDGPIPPTTRVVCGVQIVPEPIVTRHDHDLVVVARLVPKKGVDLTIRALAQARHRHPDLQLAIIGDGEQRGALEALAEQLGVASAVSFLGARPHDETLQVIAHSRALVLSARVAQDGDRDSMPVVIKEALMRAVPVIATDVVGIPEMVDQRVGRLVPPEDVESLAAAMVEVLTDERARREMGAAGRRRAIDRFSLEANVAILDALWAERLDGRRP